MLIGEEETCEFNVIVNGETVFRDVVYAKAEDDKVIVKDITGELKEFRNCRIEEVDVNSTRLVLSLAPTKSHV